MKKYFTLKSVILVTISIMVLSSCGTSDKVATSNLIQKRKYNHGLFIKFLAKKQNVAKANSTKEIFQDLLIDPLVNQNEISIKEVFYQNYDSNNLLASSNDELILTSNNKSDFNINYPIIALMTKNSMVQPDTACDIIILKNGNEIKAKVLEVGQTEIKYKMCDNLGGPIFTIYKSEIFMIKYPNGTNTVINADNNKTNSEKPTNEKENGIDWVAFILCFLFGIIGVHRFYLGDIAIGIIQLLTLGGCGIWALIDFIRICTGDLKRRKYR